LIIIPTPLFEGVPGDDHPNTFIPQDKLAMNLLAAGRTVEAILLERTVADCERMLGADHPTAKRARRDLAAVTGEPESR
jgi:hypothetical protein